MAHAVRDRLVSSAAERRVRERSARRRTLEERPIWQTIGLLYLSIVLLVALVITVAFLAAALAAGTPY